MTTFNIHVEETDQTFPIPADIGERDDLIKRAIAGVVPYIDTAKLTREEKDGITTIKVIKSHAPKGAGEPGSLFFVIQTWQMDGIPSIFESSGCAFDPRRGRHISVNGVFLGISQGRYTVYALTTKHIGVNHFINIVTTT